MMIMMMMQRNKNKAYKKNQIIAKETLIWQIEINHPVYWRLCLFICLDQVPSVVTALIECFVKINDKPSWRGCLGSFRIAKRDLLTGLSTFQKWMKRKVVDSNAWLQKWISDFCSQKLYSSVRFANGVLCVSKSHHIYFQTMQNVDSYCQLKLIDDFLKDLCKNL